MFQRLYGPDHTRRFLLADEVGLGKTLVAKGVIARAIEHSRSRVQRHRRGLHLLESRHRPAEHQPAERDGQGRLFAGRRGSRCCRLTAAPNLRDQRLNFVSFTPGTSFDLKSAGRERGAGAAVSSPAGRMAVQRRGAAVRAAGRHGIDGFRRQVDGFALRRHRQRASLSSSWPTVAKEPRLRDEFADLCGHFHRADARVPDEACGSPNALVGELRALLARTCLQSLQPDLIILDEFQRFKHLLPQDRFDRDSRTRPRPVPVLGRAFGRPRAAAVGHAVQDVHDEPRVGRRRPLHRLPRYRAFSCSTIRPRRRGSRALLKEYRAAALSSGRGRRPSLDEVRRELETGLRGVMCRTERLAVTADRSGMLREVPASAARWNRATSRAYVGLQKIARATGTPTTPSSTGSPRRTC